MGCSSPTGTTSRSIICFRVCLGEQQLANLQLLHRTCHDQKSARDGSATCRRQRGVHAKNRVTEEPNAEKLARSVLQGADRSGDGQA